jgi:hypothetical protein
MEDNYPATETFGPIPAQEPECSVLSTANNNQSSQHDIAVIALQDKLNNLSKAYQGELEAHSNTAVKLQRTEASYASILRPLIDAVMESSAFSTMIDSRVAKALEEYTESSRFTDAVSDILKDAFDIEDAVNDAIDSLEFTVEVSNHCRSYRR